jgi:hypothetical protein
MVKTLGQALLYGRGKSGAEIERLYELSKLGAAEEFSQQGSGWGPALATAYDNEKSEWRGGAGKRAREEDFVGPGGGRGGKGPDCCPDYNSPTGCPNQDGRCPKGKHVCYRKVNGRRCGKKHSAHEHDRLMAAKKMARPEEGEAGPSDAGRGADGRTPSERAKFLGSLFEAGAKGGSRK